MRELKDNPLIPPLLLVTFFSMLAYLPLIPNLGFYSDDFFFGYVAHFYGSEGLIKSLVIDRPFNGYLLNFYYFVLSLHDNVFVWHIFIFFVRLIGGYVLLLALFKIWPKNLSVITSVTLLFLTYPGFLQQVVPLGFGGWITTLTIWVLSFAFTVFAIKSIKKFKFVIFTLISLILQINSFLQLEFFIGIELFRLLMIALILKNTISIAAIKKTVTYWGPYVLSLTLFILWRILIFKSIRPETNVNWVLQSYYSDPFWIIKIPIEIFQSLLHTVIFAYLFPSIINLVRLPLENSVLAFLIGIISAILLYFYYKSVPKEVDDTKKLGRQLFIIGLISTLVALLPIIFAGRMVRLFNVLDRYTISSVIGVSFVIVGFLYFKITAYTRRWILILLIMSSVTSHLMNGYWHKIMWDKQKDLWWQLYWRAPNIQNNAMLILYFPPLNNNILFNEIINSVRWYRFYWVDYQIWAPGNLFFNYNNSPQTHFSGDFLEDKGIVDKIRNQITESITDRNITYTRDFRNTVIISTPSDTSCLWVLDKEKNELPSYADKLLKTNIAYSDVNKLVKSESPITPPREIFGSEPPHDWCYYFQKASLARQLKNWDQLSKLKEEVINKNLKPKDPNEWLPFQKDLR